MFANSTLDEVNRLVYRHTVSLRPVSETERNRILASVVFTGDELERNLRLGVRANLLRHTVARVVESGSHAEILQLVDYAAEVVGVLFCDRNANDLFR